MLKPCADCGELSEANRCDKHKLKRGPKTNTNHVAYKNNAKWKRLSKKLRKMSPHCEICGTSDDLTIDHIIRVVDRPELAYEVDNCRVLCRHHNGKLANTPATPEAEAEVLAKVEARRARRHRLTGGLHQPADAVRPRAKAKLPTHTPVGYTNPEEETPNGAACRSKETN